MGRVSCSLRVDHKKARVLESGIKIPLKHRGAFAEHIAIIWLLENGYEVFKNISSHGKCDIVGFINDFSEKVLIDVKTCCLYRRADKSIRLCPVTPDDYQVKNCIKTLCVCFYDGQHFIWWQDDAENYKNVTEKLNEAARQKA